MGVVIGFFLRAYRVCSPEFLQQEMQHIFETFEQLKYPKGLLMNLKKKAQKIRDRATERRKNRDTRKQKPRAFICIPNFEKVEIIARYLQQAGTRVVIGTGKKSGGILKDKRKRITEENSIVYRIPCGGCDKQYIGETGRGLKTRITEHKRDMRGHVLSNAMVVHADKVGHLPRWEHAELLERGIDKEIRKALEAAHIQTKNNVNTRTGFYTMARTTAELALQRRRAII